MKRVDHNFAPKGYKAVVDNSLNGCTGCAFESSNECGLGRRCAAVERPDKRNVIFKRRKELK